MGQRGERRRRLLLQAALELFGRDGYEATTTKSIAERTGCTEAVLFRHYPTKRDLFRAVLTEFGPGELLRVPYEGLQTVPLAEALQCLISEYLERTWEHRRWLRVLWQEASRDPEAAQELSAQYRTVGERLRELLRERAAQGELDTDAVEAGAQIISLAVRGFLARSRRLDRKTWEAERQTFVANLARVVTDGIKAHRSSCREVCAPPGPQS